MSDSAHPGKMHMYNLRGYCWCGAHRDDWLRDEAMLERIADALKTRNEDSSSSGQAIESKGESQ